MLRLSGIRLEVLCLIIVLFSAPTFPAQLATASSPVAEERPTLEVRTEPSGGVRAIATVLIPAPLRIVQDILSDYARWPELFEVKMRLARLEQHEGRAIIDMYIKHAFLPGERRLLCESETLAGGGLVTKLLGGDFRRYHRTWKLSPEKEGGRTRADFELLVEVESMAPDWLVAFTLKRELQAHLRLVAEKAVERANRER